MLCFRDNGTWFFGGVLEVLHQFHRKNTTGVPSVSTGYRYNRKTPADPFRKRILRIPSYSMKRGTAWLRQLMLHVWFKQCDVWPQPRTNSSVELPTSSFTLQKNKKWKSLRKANKECSPFQWYWNQPLKKKCVFRFPNVFTKKKTTNFPDSSDALLPQQDGRQRPHDGHGEQGSQDFCLWRVEECGANVAPCHCCFGGRFGQGLMCFFWLGRGWCCDVNTRKWGFKGKESWCKTSESKVKNLDKQKNKATNHWKYCLSWFFVSKKKPNSHAEFFALCINAW